MITHIIIKMLANAESKYRTYKASLKRAHGALENPTASFLTRCANAKPRCLFRAYSK